jgi:uncharacterized membrane protein (DUF106 family)
MLMPGEDVYLTAMQDRLRTFGAQKDEARRRNDRARVEELRAQIDELEADYDHVVFAAIAI